MGSGRDINKDVVVSSTQIPNVVMSTTTGGAVGISVVKAGARTLPQ